MDAAVINALCGLLGVIVGGVVSLWLCGKGLAHRAARRDAEEAVKQARSERRLAEHDSAQFAAWLSAQEKAGRRMGGEWTREFIRRYRTG